MTPDHEPDALREQSPPYAPPPETQQLIDELYREELREARAMKPADKILAGQHLFEGACRMTLAGIRNQNPGLSEEQCLEILRQRLVLQRRLEETSGRRIPKSHSRPNPRVTPRKLFQPRMNTNGHE